MKELTERHADIRRFLLGQVSEESAEKTEERIFVEPDFDEEVRIVEGELIEAYRAGDLSAEERALFERRYLTSAAGRVVVAYEDAFIDFVRMQSVERRGAAAAGSPVEASARPEAETDPARRREGPRRWNLSSLLAPLWATRRAAAFSLLAALVLLLAAGIWLQSRRHSPPPDPARVERSARETELARLNADDAVPRGREVAAVTLSPAERNAGTTQRVAVGGDAPDGLVSFRLNLTQNAPGPYRASFLDDRGNELFAVSNLSARDTPEGAQLRLLVPVGYFRGGDYQITLGRAADGGGYAPEGSYTFRVTNAR